MHKPKHQFTCPVCGYSETPWQKETHAFHHDFLRIRVKHKIGQELAEVFFEEHPDIEREESGGRNAKNSR